MQVWDFGPHCKCGTHAVSVEPTQSWLNLLLQRRLQAVLNPNLQPAPLGELELESLVEDEEFGFEAQSNLPSLRA